MLINAKNFLKGTVNFRRFVNGPVESVPRYSYESQNKLYDVVIIDGEAAFLVNGFRTQTAHPIHKEIVKHFELDVG